MNSTQTCLQRHLIIMIVALVATASSIHAVHAAKQQTRVVVYTATTGPIVEQIHLSGTVNSPKIAQLSSEVSGLVKSFNVDKGSQLERGDVIITLDTELEELSLKAAEASMRSAEAELADARRRLEDGQRLAKQKNISASELKSLQAEVNIANANLQRYVAEKRLQEARVERHVLTAPFSGIISQKYVEVGEWINPGDAIAELFSNENIRIDFQVPQRAFPRMQHVVKLAIRIDALPRKVFDGQIDTIVPFSSTDARTFLMRATLKDSNAQITHGMSTTAILQLDSGQQAIIVPKDAVVRYPDGRITVWVVQTSEGSTVVRERRIKTGPAFDSMLAVLDGISDGDRVVVEGNESLRDGQKVVIYKP